MAVNGADIAARAQNYLSLKYVWGGTSLTSGADCSGFAQSLFAQFGIKIPRVTYDQINAGTTIDYSDLQAGDLVFFDTDRNTNGPDHVGIYLGKGKFIHAPRPGDSVKISDIMDDYYGSRFMGGRRPTGMVGGGPGDGGVGNYGSAAAQPKPSAESLAATYGWAYSFLTSNSELNGIFQKAVAETWDAAKFKAAVQETSWWKNSSESVRQAQIESTTDPATFQARVNAASMKVRMVANEIGAILPEDMMAKIGEDVIRTGMTDEELQYTLGKYIDFTKEGTLSGQAGMAEIRLRQLARANGVQISNDAIKNYAQMIAMGVSTMEQAEQYVRNMAKSMFPAYAEQVDAGINMVDIASPYMQLAAKNLELDPGSVTLDRSIIKQGLNGMDSKGQPHGMNLNDYEVYLRQNPQWLQTNNARESLTKVGADILRNMGLTG